MLEMQGKALRRRVLLMCVGTNDPEPKDRPGQLGPVLSFMDYLERIPEYQVYKPDRIYLISTAKKPGAFTPTEDRGIEVQQRLKRMGYEEVYHRPLDVLDPTNYGELLPKMKELVQSILGEEENKGAEILINVSPGTGQMEAVWIALINSGALKAKALQVKAPWIEPDEKKRVREVDFTPLFESDFIKIAHDLFAQYAFGRAAEVLEELAIRTPDWVRAEKAELFADLARAYMRMENFEYPEAKEALISLLERHKNVLRATDFQSLKNLIEDQKQIVEKLLQGNLLIGALDLYASAERCLQLQRYVECIWRLWATYELVVTERARQAIRSRLSLDPSFPLPFRLYDFANKNRGDPSVRTIIGFFGGLDRVPKYLGRDVAESILVKSRKEEPSLSQFIQENEDEVEWLAQLRHRAVHETNPPTQEDCNKGKDLIRKLLKQAFNLERIDYPFLPRPLEKIAEMISQI
jgi:hypothetical protein